MDEKYITNIEYKEGKLFVSKAIGLLNGYINYLKAAKNNYQKNKKQLITYN